MSILLKVAKFSIVAGVGSLAAKALLNARDHSEEAIPVRDESEGSASEGSLPPGFVPEWDVAPDDQEPYFDRADFPERDLTM